MKDHSLPTGIAAFSMRTGRLFIPLTLALVAPCFALPDFVSEVRPILEAHCFECHGPEKQKGGLRLDTLGTDLAKDRVAAESWHDVRDALQRSEMPPEEEPALNRSEQQILTSWITGQLKVAVEAGRKNVKPATLRRLNREEYQNTMSDLLGVEMDFVKSFPPDTLSEAGFRNEGASLQMSGLQLEYYLESATRGLARAIVSGPRPETFTRTFLKSIKDKGRGSSLLDHDQQFVAKIVKYPENGEILIRAKVRAKLVEGRGYPQLRAAIGYRADTRAPRAFLEPVDVTNEDWQVIEFRGRIEDFPLPSKTQSKFPGLLVWLDNAYAEGRDKPLKPRRKPKQKKGNPGKQKAPTKALPFPSIEIASVVFAGPVFDQWPPASHRDLVAHAHPEAGEEEQIQLILKNFMRRAFRRPILPEEIKPYSRFFQTIRTTTTDFEEALRKTIAMVLISPDFLYLVEPACRDPQRPLTDWELASRLSYFLWSSMPDAPLFELAERGELGNPKVLREQVNRMLADPKSQHFVNGFAGQWLDVGALRRVAIDPNHYPDFDPSLKEAMREETLSFFAEILRENLSALNLLDSDFTMLNGALANHYGLDGPRGRAFERVKLSDTDPRGGVLTHGSFLLGNSTGDDSHPVKRAVWIRERLLDNPPADPPPDVPDLDSTNPDFAKLSVRDQLEAHRKKVSCNECHRSIDPWGIPLEHFGADGRWRDMIQRKKINSRALMSLPVESASTLPGGHEVQGIDGLKEHLVRHRSQEFSRALTVKLLTYALGRRLEMADEEVVNSLTTKFIAADHRIKPLINFIVASPPFQQK